MTITIDPALESYVQEHAQSLGLTVETYIERLVSAERLAEIDSLDSIHRGLADVQAGRVTP
jgi:predicted transcriptional regulator